MGFWDSFEKAYKKEYEKERLKSQDRQKYSRYQTIEQKEYNHFVELDNLTDSELFRKVRSSFVSEEDKEIIESILRNRGYIKKKNGLYDRGGAY